MVLSVKQTVEGIRYEHIEKIFEPFVTNKDTGRGLEMDHEDGGHVQVNTEVIVGSEIKILLPVANI